MHFLQQTIRTFRNVSKKSKTMKQKRNFALILAIIINKSLTISFVIPSNKSKRQNSIPHFVECYVIIFQFVLLFQNNKKVMNLLKIIFCERYYSTASILKYILLKSCLIRPTKFKLQLHRLKE